MDKRISKQKKSYGKIIIYIAIGLIFGWMISAMFFTGTWNIKDFYDSGYIYDVDFEKRMAAGQGIDYESNVGNYVVQEETGSLNYVLLGKNQNWNYLYLTVKQLNCEQIDWKMQFYQNGVFVGEKTVSVTEGENEIPLLGKPFNSLNVLIEKQVGTTFTIQKMQFRELQTCMTMSGFLLVQLISALVFWMILYLGKRYLLKGRRPSFYVCIDFLQEFWIKISKVFGEYFYSFSEKKRNIVRSVLVFVMVLSMSVMENMVNMHSKPYYGISMGICCMCMLGMALVSQEGTLKKLNWNNPLVASWFVLWAMSIISDVIVNKRYQYQGYIMIFFVGYLFFVWGNMKQPWQMIWSILKGCEGVFWFTTIFIYFCRPEQSNARYLGFFRNTNIESIFSAAATVLFLVELDQGIVKKKKVSHIIWYVLGLLIACDRTWRTSGRTGMITVIATIAVFFLHAMYQAKSRKRLGKTLQVFVLCVCLLVPVVKLDSYLLTHLSEALGTQVIYKRDALMGKEESDKWEIFTETVYAGETEELQIVDTSERRSLSALFQGKNIVNTIEAYSSGRTLYYLEYVRQMNLFGHYYHARKWGDYIHPHNGVLEIMYRYGVFAGIPYVVMGMISLWYALLYSRKKKKEGFYNLFPFLATVNFMCTMLYENSEKPFVWMTWILYYIGMGILFVQEDCDEEY